MCLRLASKLVVIRSHPVHEAAAQHMSCRLRYSEAWQLLLLSELCCSSTMIIRQHTLTRCMQAASVKKLKEEREKTPPLTQRQEGQSVQDLIRSSLGDYEVRSLVLCWAVHGSCGSLHQSCIIACLGLACCS